MIAVNFRDEAITPNPAPREGPVVFSASRRVEREPGSPGHVVKLEAGEGAMTATVPQIFAR